jgi:hypothetical protein
MPTLRPGQTETEQRGRTAARRWLLPIVVLALAAGGCAQPGTQATDETAATPAEPATVTIGPDDSGKTVDLKVGDRLVVELRAAKQPSRFPRAWTLEVPRSKVLKRVDRDSTFMRVVLIAEAPGTVRLLLLQRGSCDPPRLCPMAEPSGQSERMHRPLPAVTITIRVH